MPQSVPRFGAYDTVDESLWRGGVCAVGLCRNRLDQGEDSLGVQSRDRDCIWPTLSDPLQDICDIADLSEYGGVDVVIEIQRQLQKERRSVAGPKRMRQPLVWLSGTLADDEDMTHAMLTTEKLDA